MWFPTTCLIGNKVKVTQSCPTLCDPMDYTARGIFQARILEWVVILFSRRSSQPRDRTQVSHIAGGFTHWATREAHLIWNRDDGNFSSPIYRAIAHTPHRHATWGSVTSATITLPSAPQKLKVLLLVGVSSVSWGHRTMTSSSGHHSGLCQIKWYKAFSCLHSIQFSCTFSQEKFINGL